MSGQDAPGASMPAAGQSQTVLWRHQLNPLQLLRALVIVIDHSDWVSAAAHLRVMIRVPHGPNTTAAASAVRASAMQVSVLSTASGAAAVVIAAARSAVFAYSSHCAGSRRRGVPCQRPCPHSFSLIAPRAADRQPQMQRNVLLPRYTIDSSRKTSQGNCRLCIQYNDIN